jgi:4a-hydroxytetrahydrobiopterin dehydratase
VTATGAACPDDRSDHKFSGRQDTTGGRPLYAPRTPGDRRTFAAMANGPNEQRLDEPLLNELVSELEGWTSDGTRLTKTHVRKGWKSAIALVNAVAEAAQRADHHPDIHVEDYKKVRFVLTTHASGGISQSDIDLAKEIDRLAGTQTP